MQVLEKYGDIYGRERIAELLGMDLASLDVSQQHEKKPEGPDTSMFSWYCTHARTHSLAYALSCTCMHRHATTFSYTNTKASLHGIMHRHIHNAYTIRNTASLTQGCWLCIIMKASDFVLFIKVCYLIL